MSLGERPIKGRRTTPVCRLAALAVAALAAMPAAAQAQGLPLIRDAEIEQLLRDYSAPVLRAAGLAQQNIRIVVINERAFNAFVADSRRIFINTGALSEAATPNEIIGVLAHETGHIAGGHLAKLREELRSASTQSIIAAVLGVGAMVAAAQSGSTNAAHASAAALSAPQEVIRRSLLSYLRAHEEQADRAGVKFLNATSQSPKGMHETFKRLADQLLFAARGADPYMQSHPMPAERVAALGELARASPFWDKKDPADLQLRHDLMRAKLSGFIDRPDTVARRYPASDTSLAARYARAISAYRHSDLRGALSQIDGLIQAQPNNPYFYELKGQALLESGQPAAAIAPLRHAVKTAPNPALIQIMLAQALTASKESKYADEAVTLLRAAIAKEPESPDAYTQLAMAFGRKGDLAQADLASALAAVMRGDARTARDLATRAKTRFPVGSPGWVKADDIISSKAKVN
ncbi:MAG TPA: M48 family metalloprotease [Xanthobacteraceae bacterium]|nr:M48 family metalloprotease [Xanthobacteraceae bacterium]